MTGAGDGARGHAAGLPLAFGGSGVVPAGAADLPLRAEQLLGARSSPSMGHGVQAAWSAKGAPSTPPVPGSRAGRSRATILVSVPV